MEKEISPPSDKKAHINCPVDEFIGNDDFVFAVSRRTHPAAFVRLHLCQ